jgi:transcriptional regulator with XRE-family HTH domain
LKTAGLDSVGARLRWAIEEQTKVSHAEFARRAGIDPTQLSRYVKNRNAPREDLFERMAELAGVSVAWLRYGVGEPVEREERPEDVVHVAGGSDQLAQLLETMDATVRFMSKAGAPGTGTRQKLGMLNAVRELMVESGSTVPGWWFELREKVESGAL